MAIGAAPYGTTTVLIDMDGPLADFDWAFWDACTVRGFTFDIDTHEDQRHRYFTEHIPDRNERRRARAMVDAAGWFRHLPVTPGAEEGVEALLAEGFDVWVCTKPLEANRTCLNDKHAWLVEHFPALSDRLITAPNKAMIHGTVLLDDAPKPEWFAAATWEPVIFPAPFNAASYPDLRRWTWGQDVPGLLG